MDLQLLVPMDKLSKAVQPNKRRYATVPDGPDQATPGHCYCVKFAEGMAQQCFGSMAKAREFAADRRKADDLCTFSYGPIPKDKHGRSWPLVKGFTLDGHRTFQGLKIAIENRKGTCRRGKDQDGEPWVTKMFWPYGYIVGTEAVDGDALDCYIGPNDRAAMAYIVHQRNPETGGYDEDKCMLGFDSPDHARDAYLAHYNDYRFLGPIQEMPMGEFIEKVKSHKYDRRMLKGLPEMQPGIRMMPVKHLRRYVEHHWSSDNHRITDKGYRELKRSIKAEGFKEPLLLEKDPETGHALLTEGNHRLAVAHELGITHVPVRTMHSDYPRGNYRANEWKEPDESLSKGLIEPMLLVDVDEPLVKGRRYNRGSMTDSIGAAWEGAKKHNRPYFVHPTVAGYKVGFEKPEDVQHYEVHPDGTLRHHKKVDGSWTMDEMPTKLRYEKGLTGELVKGHVESYTRIRNGKLEHVGPYDNKRTRKPQITEQPRETITTEAFREAIDAARAAISTPLDPSEVKANLVTQLTKRLANSPEFIEMAERNVLNTTIKDVGNEIFGVSETDADLAAHIAYMEKSNFKVQGLKKAWIQCSKLVAQWASTSGDHDQLSIAIQEAARQEFNLNDSKMWQKDMVAQAAVRNHMADMPGIRAWLRAMYRHTQDWLAQSAPNSPVALWRGCNWNKNEVPQEVEWLDTITIGGMVGLHWSKIGSQQVMTQPMNSWSASQDVADAFSGDQEYSANSVHLTLFSVIPPERLISTCITGLGCSEEQEAVVMGGPVHSITIANTNRVGQTDFKIDNELAIRMALKGHGRYLGVDQIPATYTVASKNGTFIEGQTRNIRGASMETYHVSHETGYYGSYHDRDRLTDYLFANMPDDGQFEERAIAPVVAMFWTEEDADILWAQGETMLELANDLEAHGASFTDLPAGAELPDQLRDWAGAIEMLVTEARKAGLSGKDLWAEREQHAKANKRYHDAEQQLENELWEMVTGLDQDTIDRYEIETNSERTRWLYDHDSAYKAKRDELESLEQFNPSKLMSKEAKLRMISGQIENMPESTPPDERAAEAAKAAQLQYEIDEIKRRYYVDD